MNDSSFLTNHAAVNAGWEQSAHAVQQACVSCPICETLISSVCSDGSTRCSVCDWKPGQWPWTTTDQTSFAGIVTLRLGTNTRNYTPSDVGALRHMILHGEYIRPVTPPGPVTPPANLHLTLAPAMLTLLDRLATTGMFLGDTPGTVAIELLCEAARRWKGRL